MNKYLCTIIKCESLQLWSTYSDYIHTHTRRHIDALTHTFPAFGPLIVPYLLENVSILAETGKRAALLVPSWLHIDIFFKILFPCLSGKRNLAFQQTFSSIFHNIPRIFVFWSIYNSLSCHCHALSCIFFCVLMHFCTCIIDNKFSFILF